MDENTIRQKLGLSKIQWREIGMKLKRLVEGRAALTFERGDGLRLVDVSG